MTGSSMRFLRHRLFPVFTASVFVLSGCIGDGTSKSEGLETTEQPIVVCAKGPTVEGIDVSEWQGSIDWGKVKGSGRAFAIARVSYGTGHLDPYFGGNWSGMKSAGLIRGAYQWFRPAQDPIAQADIVVAHVGVLGAGDLPVTADVEETQGVAPATIAARLHSWVDRITAGTGKAPIIYTGKYFWNDNVKSGDFKDLSLWIAAYSPPCPDLPIPWGDWRMFQYNSNGIIPGISGNVDIDKFNGSLEELEAFAGIVRNKPPHGWLDEVSCDRIRGWSQDTDSATSAIDVHLYFDSVPGDAAPTARAVHAGIERTDLCGPLGSCNHSFDAPTPLSLLDGKPHTVHAYGIDSSGKGPNPELSGSPKTMTCARPTPPLAPEVGVRRWIPSPEVLAAWKFDPFQDMVVYSDAEIAKWETGRDLPKAPLLIATDDPAIGIQIVDDTLHRHVQNPDSMSEWRFDWGAVVKWSPAEFAKLSKSAEWRQRPFLMKGDGPAVYLLDDRTEARTIPVGGPNDGGVDAGHSAAPTEDAPSVDTGSSGSCSIGDTRDEHDRPRFVLLAALAIAVTSMRRRERNRRVP